MSKRITPAGGVAEVGQALPIPGPPALALAFCHLGLTDRKLLVGEAHRLTEDDLAFTVRVAPTAGVSGQGIHDFMVEVRRQSLAPLIDAANEARQSPSGLRATQLAERLAKTREEVASCDLKASQALAKAREELSQGADPTRQERAAREAKVQWEILQNRIAPLEELAQAAAAESLAEVRQAVAAAQAECLATAQARLREIEGRMAQALNELVGPWLQARAEITRMTDSPSAVANGRTEELLAHQIAAGEDIPSTPRHGQWLW